MAIRIHQQFISDSLRTPSSTSSDPVVPTDKKIFSLPLRRKRQYIQHDLYSNMLVSTYFGGIYTMGQWYCNTSVVNEDHTLSAKEIIPAMQFTVDRYIT